MPGRAKLKIFLGYAPGVGKTFKMLELGRETVPDTLLDRADQIELVDVPPDELLVRMAEGKVSLSGPAARTAEQVFQRGNLLALRELALRRAAEHVDAEARAHRKAHAG